LNFFVLVQTLETPDIHRVNAAMGWLELGNPVEARVELDAVTPGQQTHPAVLEVRWLLCAREEGWREGLAVAETQVAVAPEDAGGWLHRAYALRRVEGGGLAQAWTALLPAAAKFPGEPVIPYNLACYACQLRELETARDWLRQAVKVGGPKLVRQMALADDDLQPLWPEIAKL
jgi:Flp pilus assembly protein TadD